MKTDKEKARKAIEAAVSYVKELFEGNVNGHGVDHTFRVYSNALALGKEYPNVDSDLISLISLLHDVDDPKLFDTKDNQNARAFLIGQEIASEDIEAICRAIGEVSFSKNRGKKPTSLEAMIVQDADRLDAMGAIGVARAFAYGGEKGRSMKETIDHFHEKLLLLKDLMNTEPGKRVAQKRHEFLLLFLKEYEEETGDASIEEAANQGEK